MNKRIVIDGMSCRVGGGLSYLVNQLTALIRLRPDLELTLLTSPHNRDLFKSSLDVEMKTIPLGSPALRVVYEQSLLPRRSRGAILYCPGNFIPLFARGVPTVLTLQNPNYFGQGPKHRGVDLIKKHLAWASARRADAVVVISRTLLSSLTSDGISPRRLKLIYSGRSEWATASSPPVFSFPLADFILSLGNDYPHKKLHCTVESWGLAVRRGLTTSLLIAGNVPTDRQTQLLHKLPPAIQQQVHFVGPVAERAEVRWLLENATALISTSSLEAFPLTLSEAGSVGCPLLLSDIPAHREVAGTNALYARAGDLAGFANHLLKLARQSHRPVWTSPMTWDDNAHALGELFDEITRARVQPLSGVTH